jgi:hypothetical protein
MVFINTFSLSRLISFLFQMSKTAASRSFNAAARQLAEVFGPSLTHTSIQDSSQTPGRRANEWAICLIELLIHAHQQEGGTSQVWEVSLAFQDEIKDGVRAAATPKRSMNCTLMNRLVLYAKKKYKD